MIGSAIAVAAVVDRSFPFFLFGLVLVGMARSAVDLGRFVAAEVHLPAMRGRAISNVVLGSTVGAIFGPLLVGPMGRLATWAGYPEFAGAYILGAAVLVVAAMLIFGGLRPDPRDVGRELARIHPALIPQQATRSLAEIVRQPGVIVAMVTMAFAQMVMVVPMSITSVHMKAHQHPLTAVSLVISAHTFGMFAFSLISGRMADRLGRGPVIILGSTVMILSCLMAAPSINLLPLAVALFLLGLGWNFAYVAGSTLLADQLSARGKGQNPGIQRPILEPGLGSQPGRERGGVCRRRLRGDGAGSGGDGRGAAGICRVVADTGTAGANRPGPKRVGKPEGIKWPPGCNLSEGFSV